jgi:hypothetical protein
MTNVPEKGEREQPVETGDVRETLVRERSVQQEVVGFGAGRHQRILYVAAAPLFEDGKLVKEREPGIGDQSSGLEGP